MDMFRFRYMQKKTSEAGFSIIENMIAISILGIVLAASSNSIIMAMQANSSARAYSTMTAEVQGAIDNYRSAPFDTLLAKFGTSNYTSITDGQAVTETSYSNDARTNYSTTFTAVKSAAVSTPIAVKIKVDAVQRRGKLGDAHFSFETVVAHFG